VSISLLGLYFKEKKLYTKTLEKINFTEFLEAKKINFKSNKSYAVNTPVTLVVYDKMPFTHLEG